MKDPISIAGNQTGFIAQSVESGTWNDRQSLYIVFLTVAALVVTHAVTTKPSDGKIPRYNIASWKWLFRAEDLLKSGYKKFRDDAYQIHGPEGAQIILPIRYIPQAKLMSDDILNTEIETNESLQTQYTGFPMYSEIRQTVIKLLRSRLALQNLYTAKPQLETELHTIIANEFPPCDDWTPFKWMPFCLRTISRVSGCIFVGNSVSHQETWTDISINFAMYVFVAGAKIQLFPHWLRPIMKYGVTELGKINRCLDNAAKTLEPLLEEKRRALESSDPSTRKHELMIDAIIDALPEKDKWNSDVHAQLQLMLAAAAIHASGQILCECMYDLALYPELQDELRREIFDMQEAEGEGSDKGGTSKLPKMDSFMKEVQRFRGNMASFRRRVMQDVTFDDGLFLPANTSILCGQTAVSQDDRFYSNPEEFDALRFYHLRQQEKSQVAANRWQFTSPSDFNMNFGIGKHTCPGRFFASTMIKMILVHFILNYDVRLKPGAQRPKSWTIVMTKSPDPTAELEFKKRV